jgi:hypothetical protein
VYRGVHGTAVNGGVDSGRHQRLPALFGYLFRAPRGPSQMTPFAYQVIQDVAAEWGVDPALIAGKCRIKRIVCARVDAVKRMRARGYTTPLIGRQVSLDHTTILYYLGRSKNKKPPMPEWRAPKVRNLYWITPQKIVRAPPKMTRYLVPYAGADWTEYRWKERPNLFGDSSDERYGQAGDRASGRQPAREHVARTELRANHDQAA